MWTKLARYAHIASSIDTGASAKKEKAPISYALQLDGIDTVPAQLHSANVMAKRKDEVGCLVSSQGHFTAYSPPYVDRIWGI